MIAKKIFNFEMDFTGHIFKVTTAEEVNAILSYAEYKKLKWKSGASAYENLEWAITKLPFFIVFKHDGVGYIKSRIPDTYHKFNIFKHYAMIRMPVSIY